MVDLDLGVSSGAGGQSNSTLSTLITVGLYSVGVGS